MIDFYNLNKRELERNGLVFGTDEETALFAEMIEGELDLRIGDAISKCATEEQLKVFDSLYDPQDMRDWLKTYCPDYGNIVKTKMAELDREIRENIDKIPGLIRNDKG